jgi:hypothetical protein
MPMNNLTPDQHRILVGAIHDSATVVHKGRMMNERIRELAEQAEFSERDLQIQGDNFQRFAELIIQKCKSQIALIGVSNFENKDIMWTVETAIANIEEHFGVKL